ncbi:MAG: hypothetical protein V2I82_04510 [Halieaceae bacterium]|nr:hypothetical protein [Halieaceae bacterium]
MTKDISEIAVSASERAEFIQGALDAKILKFDPVTAIKIVTTVVSIAKEIGLFGKDSSVDDAIADIYSHINRLYQEIENLHVRLDEVRSELINLVLEVEYRNIAADVIGLSQGVGSLEGGSEHSFLDAAFLDSEPNNLKLLDRLDDNSEPLERAIIYLNYLDLFIYHSACRVVVVSGAPSLATPLKRAILGELKQELHKYCMLARERIFDIFQAGYTIRMCGREIFNDDDGTPFGAIEHWGYGRTETSDCSRVTTISIKVGGPAAIAHNKAQQKKAAIAVQAEIDRVARQEADSVWNEKYRSFTELEP